LATLTAGLRLTAVVQGKKVLIDRLAVILPGAALSLMLLASAAGAQEAAAAASPAVADSKVAMDTMWTLLTAFLVFFMNLGFAMVESGFCRAKNTTNILAKNYIVFAISSVAFLLTGFGLMFGDGTGIIGANGVWFVSGGDNSPATGEAYHGVYGSLSWTGTPLWAKFFFQLVFAGTAATIVSGAVAERIKFGAFFLFSFLMVGVIYPTTGHWIWGGGWLAKRGMLDFAGSTVVHSVGGWAALAGAIMLGPRLGKYTREGRALAIPGHSLTSATLGVFVLWFGWFGFNPGSTMAADWASIAHIATTTNTAAATGSIGALLTAWIFLGKPDLGMTLNGGLAGLVAITCPCAFVSVGSAFWIGVVAGVLVVLSVIFFDRIQVDDPVGAVSVHMTNGVWGTLSLGLFADPAVCPAASVAKPGLFLGGGAEQLVSQLTGVAAVGAFVLVASMIGWTIVKGIVGLRVSAEEEIEGLDLGEHGNLAYPDFQLVHGLGLVERTSLERELEEAERRREQILHIMQSAEPARGSFAGATAVAPGPHGEERRAVGEGSSRVPSPVRRTPPPPPPSPARPLTLAAGGPIRLTVANVDKKWLRAVWEDLCQQYPHNVPRAFKEIYDKVTTFRDNVFVLKPGDARHYRDQLANILYQYGVENPDVRVE
jgi:Amt family ammonium transporter